MFYFYFTLTSHGLFQVTNAFKPSDPLTALVPKLEEVDPDDAFSVVPYEKGHTFLWYLEQLLAPPPSGDRGN